MLEPWKDKPQSVRLKTNILYIARNNLSKKCCTRTVKQIIFVLCLYILLSVMFVSDKENVVFKGDHPETNLFTRNDIIPYNSSIKENVRLIRIRAMSSRDDVFVNINGITVYQNGDRNKESRGIHIAVINELTGHLMSVRHFDTSTRYVKVQQMISYLSNIKIGRIVVFVIKGDGSNQLKKTGRNAIRYFGSHMIKRIGWHDMWALISKKGKLRYAENLHISSGFDKYAEPVIIEAEIPPETKEIRCDWGSDKIALRRKKFCDAYEGYGNLCSCTKPSNIEFNGDELLGSRLRAVPITIMATNRPNYLYRMLRGLLPTLGVNRDLVTVYIDGYFNEVASIANLFDVKYVEYDPKCNGNCRVREHYKYALQDTFNKYPGAEYAIILEDDLDVADDIMDYFSQMLPLFSLDESIFCISAWNELCFDHSVNNPSLIYRVNDMPGFGWILKKKIFVDELYRYWPDKESTVDWDVWIRDSIMKGRECVIPEISRTYHFAASGGQNSQSNVRKVNDEMGRRFDRDKVIKDGYEKDITWLIENSKVLDHNISPCSNDKFIPLTKGEKYVFYIKSDKNDETWLNVASCFRLSSSSSRSNHNKLWRFWYNENMVFVISSDSPYYRHKPHNIVPLYLPKKKPTLGTAQSATVQNS